MIYGIYIYICNIYEKYFCNDFLLTQPKILNVIDLLKRYDTKYYNAENHVQSISIQCGQKYFKNFF